MKIAAIVNAYPSQTNYSDFTYVHTRLKYYIKEGNDVHVFSRSRERDEKYVLEGVKVSKIKSGKKVAVKMINEYKPDMLVVHAPHTWSLAVAKRLKGSKVSWIHGHEGVGLIKNHFINNPSWTTKILLFVYDVYKFKRLKRFLLKNEAVVYVSKWMKRNCERNIKTTIEKSYVITNPVDMEFFSFNEKHTAKPKYPRKGIALRGFSSPKYGLDIAIMAYSNYTKSRLTIIGTGELRKNLEELIRKYDSNVEVLYKSIDHMSVPSHLSNYDYFVAPSRFESQGVAMCEAMACGLPVVATNVGGIPEFVEDGINGYLVRPESPEELRKAITKINELPQDEFAQMRKKARETIYNICEIDSVCSKELDLLSSCNRNMEQV